MGSIVTKITLMRLFVAIFSPQAIIYTIIHAECQLSLIVTLYDL